jgi:SAM-dependent methyltransferase
MDTAAEKMRRFWDDRARENAAWYVDTSIDYDNPDMEQFMATGRQIVKEAFLDAPIQPAGRHLAVEIGPGIGRICAALADHFETVIGVDVSAEMIERARGLVHHPNIRFEVGNGRDLQPVETDSADFVTTFTVLPHLPSPDLVQGYLRDSARVLKTGGVLAAHWNNLPHPRAWRARAQLWRLPNRLGRRPQTDPRLERQFTGTPLTLSTIERTLQDAGMTVRGTDGLGTLFAWVWAQKD